MPSQLFGALTSRYRGLRIAVVGDFCLDRYLEIDLARRETSIETGLPVHNVVRVRSQPGAAGTILNNLVALGVKEIYPVGFAGEEGEGTELVRALGARPGVKLDHFLQTPLRRTFTYTKPLLVRAGRAPQELSRLDFKNWSPTPPAVERALVASVRQLASRVHALILMDQVDVARTGVVTLGMQSALRRISRAHAGLLILADSRRGLRGFPPVTFKMNAAELAALTGARGRLALPEIRAGAARLARRNRHPVIVTLSERGMVGAGPDGDIEHVPALPLRGEIDIVGAGDAVTANLGAALAAGATLREAITLANLAASLVIHQLGTTGTATVPQILALAAKCGMR
jgi:rfaE bifunctional protein kinase chain/domain